jgi:hypothetical protein
MKVMRPDLTLDLGNGLHMRALVPDDCWRRPRAGKRRHTCGVLAPSDPTRCPTRARRWGNGTPPLGASFRSESWTASSSSARGGRGGRPSVTQLTGRLSVC